MKFTVAGIFLLLILGFGIYYNSLNGEFIWDDNDLIQNNEYIKSWKYTPKIFTGDIGRGAGEQYNYYRPLQILTYTVDYAFNKLDVRGYHFTNILLHVFVAVCIYWLINILFGNAMLALFSSALFLAHPVHTEAVSYLSGRADPLAVLFVLLCFIFYLKAPTLKNIIFIILSYSLALLSRESSLILPILLLIYHYVFREKIEFKKYLSVVSIAFIYTVIRFTLLKSLLPHKLCSTTLLQRLPAFFAAITSYVKILFFPFNLHMEYGNKLFRFSEPVVIAGVVILLWLIIYAMREKKKNSVISFSIFWFLAGILPFSNIYPLNAYMAEHWLYLPSIGFFLILAKTLNSVYRLKGFRILAGVLFLVLVSGYSYLTIKQNGYWQDPVAFYKRTIKYAPHSAKAYNNLGHIFSQKGKKEDAAALYLEAIKVDPNHARAYYNLGNVYRELKKTKEAISAFKKAIEINPNYVKAYDNLGNLYNEMGRLEDALLMYQKAIDIDPKFASAYNNLAVTYYRQGRTDLAIEYCDRARELGYEVRPGFLKLLKPYRK